MFVVRSPPVFLRQLARLVPWGELSLTVTIPLFVPSPCRKVLLPLIARLPVAENLLVGVAPLIMGRSLSLVCRVVTRVGAAL